MNKNKKTNEKPVETPEDLPFVPPEPDYLVEHYVVGIPIDDVHFRSPWDLRVYAARLVEHRLGDEVEVTALKVKRPHLIAKTKAKLLKRPPMARLHVTVKF